MRISVIGPVYPYRGGIAHYTTQLIQALTKAGHEVQAVSFKRQYPGWLYPGVSDIDPSQVVTKIDAEYLLDPLNPITWRLAVNQITKRKPDLVVIQWWTTFWALAFTWLSVALRRKNVKVICVIHNALPHEQRFFDPWLAKMALSQGHAFIAQSIREREQLLRLLPGRVVQICQLPVYTMLADQKLPKEEARRKLGIPLQPPLILFFGIVRPYKGLKYLIESMALIKDNSSFTQPMLLVAGEIWEDKVAYQEQINRLNLSDRVHLDDRYVPDEDVAVMFSAADLFVAPYVDGTQSAAAGWALGFGLPLVVTDIVAGGISEDNQCYIRVVKAGDAEALAQAIRQVLTTPDLTRPSHLTEDEDWHRVVKTLEGLA